MPKQFITPKINSGSILVVCLWTIMILTILGLGITGLVFQEIRFSRTYSRLVTSLPLAQGALKTVFYLRDKDLTKEYDTAAELSKENKVVMCGNNSYRYFFVDKKNSLDQTEIIDESALININLVSAEVLARLPGMSEDLADEIIVSGLRPFSTINELLLVKDITSEKFLLFKDLITVYGSGKVNLNTVSKPVLVALGLDEEAADLILRFRQENKITPKVKVPAEPVTEEEASAELESGIADLANLLNDLRNFGSLGLRQEQDILVLAPVFAVKSEYLRFNVLTSSNGQEGLRYSIVIYPPTKKVLAWNEF